MKSSMWDAKWERAEPKIGASQNRSEPPYTSGSISATPVSRSPLSQRKRQFSLLTPLHSLLAFGRSGLFGPPLCGGSAPATPPPKTCFIDLVSIFVAGAQSKEFRQTTSRQSPQIPVGAPLVGALDRPTPIASPINPSRPCTAPLVPALRPPQNLQTNSATTVTIPAPDCLHPKSGTHPQRSLI